MSDIRAWSLLNDIGKVLEILNKEELDGANIILEIISRYLK